MRKIPILAGAIATGALLFAGSVLAFFTDSVSVSSSFNIIRGNATELSESSFDEERAKGLSPGSFVEKNPVLKNTGEGDRYVFFTVEHPTTESQGRAVPLFSYEASSDWQLIAESNEAGMVREVYCYGRNGADPLRKNESTESLFSGVKLETNVIKKEHYGSVQYITVTGYAPDASILKGKTNDVTPAVLWEMTASEVAKKEAYIDVVKADNKFQIGNMDVRFLENSGSIGVTNAGDQSAKVFLKLKTTGGGGFSLKNPQGDLVNVGTDEGADIFYLERPLAPGETVNDILKNIVPDWENIDSISKGTPIQAEVIAIQSENLPENADYMDIYDLTKRDGYLISRDEAEYSYESGKLELLEDFPEPERLKTGENIALKKVQLKNNSDYNQYGRIGILYSDKEVEDTSYLSNDGVNFFSITDYRNNLPNGWAYHESASGEGFYYYTKPIVPGESTPSLFTHVRTDFDSPDSIRDFDIFVFSEGFAGSSESKDYITEWRDYRMEDIG